MKKHLLQTLLVVVLSVIGVSQCWAANYLEPFSRVSRKHSSHPFSDTNANTRTYNNLGNNALANSTVEDYGNDVLKVHGIRFHLYSASASTKSVGMMLANCPLEVEPYTKAVLTYKYKIFSYASGGGRVTSELYKFDDETSAKTTPLDCTWDYSQGTSGGSNYRLLGGLRDNNTGYWLNSDERSTPFVFDNLSGTQINKITKWLVLVVCEFNNSTMGEAYEGGAFGCTGYDWAYTYRKVITFNGNGSTGGSMSDQNIDDKGNLTANAFTRTGYTFNGWNTQADGKGTTYANGAEITATADSKGPVTLYAQWKRTVTIDKQNGTSTTTIEVNCNSKYSTLPADPTRTGYTFNGWFDAKTGGNQYTKTTASTNDIPATLYAQWTAVVYNITYNVNGGSEIKEHLTYTIETATFALPVPEKDGYSFGGWFTNEACTEGQTTQIAQGSTGNKTFYAKWTPIVYNITYNVNGGSAITEHKTYTIETATFALPVPTKDGYSFGGWFTNEACTEGQTTQITQGSTGNKTFYALWNENVVSDGSDKDNVTDAAAEVNTALSTLLEECKGGKAINLTINRTIYKDGYYNTLCLPFAMSAEQITATFGDYKELKQFQSATVQGTLPNRSIVIEVEDATEIEAGKAYLISFENNGEDITSLTFNQVIVSTTEATNESGTLAYQGILAPYQLPYEDQDYLFLGANNTLYWAINDGTFMKGFRAYFKVNTNPAQTPYRAGMRATFGSHHTPTDLSPAVSGQEVRKLLEQGRVVIVNKGVKYNMNGATVQ
ncbi:MAG: InlB B-repeat-containing protein [Paludibacteraceae bacterium]|nr:InlB B-repeat-containing protein [Paludibacteraceae bacterium]